MDFIAKNTIGRGWKDGLADMVGMAGGESNESSPSFMDFTTGVTGGAGSVLSMLVNCGSIAAKQNPAGKGLSMFIKLTKAIKPSDVKAVNLATGATGLGGIAILNDAYNAYRDCFGEKGAVRGYIKYLRSFLSVDPNNKTGPGIPGDNFLNGQGRLPYTIQFENLATASAAAQEVIITDTLDKSVYDLSTFQFIDYGFDTINIPVVSSAIKFVDIYDLRPGQPNLLRIEGKLDTVSGVVSWAFTTLDLLTMQLTDSVFQGFLPPNINAPEGQGYVSYSLKLKEGLAQGTFIQNEASIVFDVNDPIITNTWENIYDQFAPNSAVNSNIAKINDTTFLIAWNGVDDISGIRDYDIYVSEDGAPFQLLLLGVEDTAMEFIGQIGSTYEFYSIAVDSAGNVEDVPGSPDASLTVTVSLEEEWSLKKASIGKLFPNPAKESVFLPVYLPEAAHVRICLIDFTGRELGILENQKIQPGEHQLEFPVEYLAKGM